jgi:predicted MFS family arabinose efflux permease
VIGFLASAALVVSVILPRVSGSAAGQVPKRHVGKGMSIYLATPRLRGLLAINLAVAAAGAMVIVNTVVLVRGILGLSDSDVALAMAAFGLGSMVAALALPRLLDRIGDRAVMLPAAATMSVLLLAFAVVTSRLSANVLWPAILVLWPLLGVSYSAAQVPTGRLLRRSVHAQDRPSLFAAQFALSHSCWLVTYPLAGWLGTAAGMSITLLVLGLVGALGTGLAFILWPAADPEDVAHEHPELEPDHPHIAGGSRTHSHAYVIDDLHRHWPVPAR